MPDLDYEEMIKTDEEAVERCNQHWRLIYASKQPKIEYVQMSSNIINSVNDTVCTLETCRPTTECKG